MDLETKNAEGYADSQGSVRVNCSLTDVLRPRLFKTAPLICLRIDFCAERELARALSGFGEMKYAADLARGRVVIDVVGGDDRLHPFRHKIRLGIVDSPF